MLPMMCAIATLTQATYFVDASRGDDANPGTSQAQAWRSLEPIQTLTLRPGDQLLLAGGQVFAGPLRLGSAVQGEVDKPILVGSFGSGQATIDGGKTSAIELDGCAFVKLQGLRVVGAGRKNGNDGIGVRVLKTRGVQLDQLDVSGFRLAGVQTGGDQDTRITHVYAHDNGGSGITTYGGYDDVPRSKRLYIGDCRAINNPGDPKNLSNHSGNGIVVGGVDEAVIEYCEASNNGWDMPRGGNGPVGIWAWNADRVTIQHCISHGNKSNGADGGGFDLDGGVTNSVMQYNLSYGNVGTGYLLCQYPGGGVWKNNIVRYNISFNDGSQNFQSGIALFQSDGRISDAQIYHNTIVNPDHAVATAGDIPGVVYRNNVFLAGKELFVSQEPDGFKSSRFENNLYTPAEASMAEVLLNLARDAKGRSGDAKLLLPKSFGDLPTDPRQLAKMRWFAPLSGSLCLNGGVAIEGSPRRDIRGTAVPRQGKPTLGAIQA